MAALFILGVMIKPEKREKTKNMILHCILKIINFNKMYILSPFKSSCEVPVTSFGVMEIKKYSNFEIMTILYNTLFIYSLHVQYHNLRHCKCTCMLNYKPFILSSSTCLLSFLKASIHSSFIFAFLASNMYHLSSLSKLLILQAFLTPLPP